MSEPYLTSIFWYCSWPILIYVSYLIIRFAITTFEKKQTK